MTDVMAFAGFASWSHAKRALEPKLPLAPWTIHDIRRSCRSLWADGEYGLGLDVHLCELMLGRALPGIIGTYEKATRLPKGGGR